ncbi:hypothetical protein TOPH_01782 [Tolypocladium ophioglossoides CBS 100239]|uniref:Uncharacterized protein n=1 Tax=Tolypocladium ophioglossoides (strain CBS 100239) TaxID=1163406 RepID=A0A0L0NIR2_TOLOC|nr:hypothetical protein TOPH_01782 [Tolypocladium ophioglossoides CBS 100239]
MMHPSFGVHTPDTLPVSHIHDAFLHDLSTQMAVSQAARRLSRSSNGQQRAGSAMRVVKPSSANTSPRSSINLSRRKTLMGDGSTPRRQHQAMDYLSIPLGNDLAQSRKQSTRPLSWHPTSYVQHHHFPYQQPTSYPFPTPNMYADTQDYYSAQPQYSPMMASYSNDTSPSSTFSPLPLFPGGDNTQYMQAEDAWDLSQRTTPFYPSCNDGQGMPEPFPTLNSATNQKTSAAPALDWNAFVSHGFNNTSPPTPESFPHTQHLHPVVSEASVPYRALDKPEEEGEILVGMGLYDVPEKFEEDPQLDNYRSTVSTLLGSSFRPHEPKGKGLKLEETWEPPKPDNGEEEDHDDDDDSE